MYTLDAYHHPSRLTALYNRVGNIRPSKDQDDSESSQVSLKAIALVELVMYIEEASRPMLSSSLIWHVPGRVNSTREVTLGFSGDIGATLHFTQSRDYDTEAMHLAEAAVLVRKELLYYIRNNALMVHLIPTACQRPAVPHLLLALEQLIS